MSSPLQKASVRARKTAPYQPLIILGCLYTWVSWNMLGTTRTVRQSFAHLIGVQPVCSLHGDAVEKIRLDRLLSGLSTSMSGLQLEPHTYAACLPSLRPLPLECIG